MIFLFSQTFCEMSLGDGAWTFIPRMAVIRGSQNRGLIDQLFTRKEEVLLVIHQPGFKKKQRYVVLRQTAEYSHVPLALFMNEHDKSPRPASVDMGPYLYLRVLPPKDSSQKTWLGFQVNGHDAKYNNHYGRVSNYFALYPNWDNRPPIAKLNKHCNTQPCTGMMQHSLTRTGPEEVPNDLLFYTEMHFGQQGHGIEQVGDGSIMQYSLAIAVR